MTEPVWLIPSWSFSPIHSAVIEIYTSEFFTGHFYNVYVFSKTYILSLTCCAKFTYITPACLSPFGALIVKLNADFKLYQSLLSFIGTFVNPTQNTCSLEVLMFDLSQLFLKSFTLTLWMPFSCLNLTSIVLLFHVTINGLLKFAFRSKIVMCARKRNLYIFMFYGIEIVNENVWSFYYKLLNLKTIILYLIKFIISFNLINLVNKINIIDNYEKIQKLRITVKNCLKFMNLH